MPRFRALSPRSSWRSSRSAPPPRRPSLTNDCDDPASSAVFARWYDRANSFLASDGGFERRRRLDPRRRDGRRGQRVLRAERPGARSPSLPAGASATSPSVCVGLQHPTFRYVFRKTSGSLLATLRVSAVLPSGVAVPVGTVPGSSAWTPSPVTLIGANLISDAVAFRFTSASDSWQVDDVYVDPSGSR